MIAFIVFVSALAAVGLANVDRVLVPDHIGTLGMTSRPIHPPRRLITSVTPDSPLAAAGAKAGEAMAFDRDSDRTRALKAGEPVGMTLYAGTGPPRHLVVRARVDTTVTPVDRLGELLGLVATAIQFSLGALIGWRRADSPAMRALAISQMGFAPFVFSEILPGEYLPDGREMLHILTFVAGFAGIACFAVLYGHGVELMRRAWMRWIVVAYVAVALAIVLGPTLLWYSIDVRPLQTLFSIVSSLGALVALISAWRRAAGTRRQRLGWILTCLGSTYLVFIATIATLRLDGGIFVPGMTLVVHAVITAATFGFAYAVLRRRVIDVEFVLNRTTVYAATSVVLAAIFIVVSQSVNRLIHFEGRERSGWIDVTIGLALAMMGRQTARWVDPRVQRLLFRRWHASTAKLKRFGTEEIHALPTHDLEAAYLEAVREFGGATTCALYLGDAGSGFARASAAAPTALPAALPTDDPIVERVRASGSRGVVLQSADAASAALALPMVVRGELVGVVLLGIKNDGESFRPDEIELLARSASQLGLELEMRRLKALEARVGDGRRPVPSEGGAPA